MCVLSNGRRQLNPGTFTTDYVLTILDEASPLQLRGTVGTLEAVHMPVAILVVDEFGARYFQRSRVSGSFEKERK